MKTISTLLLLLFPIYIFAQKEASLWYFGKNFMIDFNKDTTKIERKGNFFVDYTTYPASIADEKGKLVFYSDGITVWNNKDQIIKNATGLRGDLSILLVPIPNKKQQYYVFTIGIKQNPKSVSNNPKDVRSTDVDTYKKKYLKDTKERVKNKMVRFLYNILSLDEAQ